MTLSDVAALRGLAWDTLKEIVKSDLGKRYGRIPLKGVRYLAVDEFSTGRSGQFLTVVMDLESGRIRWVATSRGANALSKFLGRVRRSRACIEAVACDMAAGYWLALREHLPGAAVGSRRFGSRSARSIVLMAADGKTNREIGRSLEITEEKASRWRGRFIEQGRTGIKQDAPGRACR